MRPFRPPTQGPVGAFLSCLQAAGLVQARAPPALGLALLLPLPPLPLLLLLAARAVLVHRALLRLVWREAGEASNGGGEARGEVAMVVGEGPKQPPARQSIACIVG